MEYVEGISLAEYLKKKGPLPIRLACNLARQVAEGLQHAHDLGMVHRDIKPGNLMLMKNGRVKILDFGLARLRTKVLPGEGLTRTGSYMGTPEYMPPEQARDASRADGRADVYSLGATLYCLLTGRPPFVKENALDVMLAHVQEIPRPLHQVRPEIPEGLSAVVARMLAKEPAQRYQTAELVKQALMPFCRKEGPAQPPPLPWQAPEEDSVGSLPLPQADAAEVETGPGPAEHEETLVQPPRRKPLGRWLVLGLGLLLALVPTTAFLLWAGSRPGKATEPSPTGGSAPADRSKGGPRRDRPALVDCTGKEGVSATAMQAAQEAWATYLGRKVEEEVEIAPGVKMAFVLVPPGRFLMGSLDGETGRDKDELQHEVEIAEPYYLGKYEVTQVQYEAVAKENPSKFKGPNLPVENLTWTQAAEFGKALTKNSRGGLLFCLPQEAQWEYACRGGRPSSQPFGIGDGRTLDSSQANFDGNFPYGGAAKRKYVEKTCAVGSYQANALGLFDMHGNVYEWCWDDYGDYPAEKAVSQISDLVRALKDLQRALNELSAGSTEGSPRVFRGGSWFNRSQNCRSAYRNKSKPAYRDNQLGFRVSLVLPETKHDP
jgi:formylglycine-generating enzyme required for sulfatase activity